MPRIYRLHRRDWIALFLVIFTAALLRLGDPRLVEFFHDEAMLSLMAQELAAGLTFPLTGIVSSVGVPNSPAAVYLMALPYALTDDALTATLFVAALNVAGVGLLWWIARRYFGALPALIAGLAYALNPWAVFYSRKIWAQDMHTPFVLLALALGLYGFAERRRWAQIACLPVLLFALQIHFAGWVLLPLYLWLIFAYRHHIKRRDLIVSFALGALVMLPYALGIVQTLSARPDAIGAALTRTGASGFSGDALTFTAQLATGTALEAWLAPQQVTALLANVPALPSLWAILGVLALFGLLAVWFSARPLAPLVTLWALLPLVVFAPGWTTVYPHYFVAALPAYALLTAVGLDALIGFFPKPFAARAVLMVAFAALVFTQALWWRGALRYVTTNDIALGAGTAGFTTPLEFLLRVRDAVRPLDNVIIISDGMDPHFHADAARWPVLLRQSADCVRALPPDGMLVIPDGEFALIRTPESAGSPAAALYADGTQSLRYASRGDVPYRVDFTPAPDLPVTFTALDGVRFANGAALDGYARDAGRVWLRWQLPDAPDRRFYAARDFEYQWFVHVLDASGERRAQRDAQFWLGRHWCAGDTLITWVDVDNAPSDTLRVGLYRLPETPDGAIRPVDVLDSQGNASGQWLDFD